MPGVCPRCLREVYFAEEKLALGKVWHTFCFSCRNCRKLLDSWTVATHSGELFCRNCYTRLYSTTSLRPSLPVPISPIYSSVDKKNLAVSSCESLSDHCCCFCCDEKYAIADPATDSYELVAEPSDRPTEKHRLRGGDSSDKEDDREDDPPEIVDVIDECDPENGLPELDLRSSPITIDDQSGDPTVVTAWYNKHHSASQSIVSQSSSAHQNPPRPSSTPTSESALNICNNCHSNSCKKRPGSPCRTNHRRCQCARQCHRQHCHEFQRPDSIQYSRQECKDIRGKNFADNYRKHWRPRSSGGGRSAGGGAARSCSPANACQHQDEPLCGQPRSPAGCECLGGGLDCQRCGRKVYQAEMQIASGVPYHNICFSCFCCRKPLETLTYHENCGEIYCKQCYVRNFGPQGYGYSGVLQTPM